MAVKHLRTFILILLTVLLPIRGAVAVAMLCPVGVATVGSEAHAVHEHEGSLHEDESGKPTSGDHATACKFCAGGGCCVTPLAFDPPSVERPELITSATFPALTARFPAFYPDGQDRPPRTI